MDKIPWRRDKIANVISFAIPFERKKCLARRRRRRRRSGGRDLGSLPAIRPGLCSPIKNASTVSLRNAERLVR